MIIGALRAPSLRFSISFEFRYRFEISSYLAKMLENRTNVDLLIYIKDIKDRNRNRIFETSKSNNFIINIFNIIFK